MTSKKKDTTETETPATNIDPGIVPAFAGGSETPATGAPEATAASPTVEVAGAGPGEGSGSGGGETIAAAPIKVSLIGALTGTYEGPAGKSLKDMFPSLAGEQKFQVRNAGKMVGQTEPWMISAELKTVQHARHG